MFGSGFCKIVRIRHTDCCQHLQCSSHKYSFYILYIASSNLYTAYTRIYIFVHCDFKVPYRIPICSHIYSSLLMLLTGVSMVSVFLTLLFCFRKRWPPALDIPWLCVTGVECRSTSCFGWPGQQLYRLYIYPLVQI